MHASCRVERFAGLLKVQPHTGRQLLDEDLVLLRYADGSNNWSTNAHLLLMVDSPECDVPMPDLEGESWTREE